MKQVELEEIILFLQNSIAAETKLDSSQINIDQSLGAFGLDSINSVYILHQLEDFLQIELNALLFWDYPTVRSLSSYIYHEILKKNG